MPASNRRKFLQRAGIFSATAFLSSLGQPAWSRNLETVLKVAEGISPEDLASEEDFWYYIQQSFTVSPSLINLNNGGVSPAPKTVQDAMKRFYDYSNEAPSYYMWRILDQGREPLRKNLANVAGCSPEEIAINRNSSEGLETVIFGLQLKAGDEVVASLQDYPNMINAWKQRVQREGIVYTQISFDFPIENDEAIIRSFEKAITSKTKILHITHVVNWMGQILPVTKLCQLAKKHGLKTIVDGAHSFGLLDFKIPDLGCDFFGASLHKFLSAPIGSGMLWIRKDNISDIWPLVCHDNPKSGDIRKFETLGTRSFPIEQGIGEAINFHQAIGSKRKEARIRYLKNYWAGKVKDIPKVKIHTSLQDDFSCAICGVSIDGMTPGELETELFVKYKIHSISIVWENISCVRITPHVYTRLKDLDRLVNALETIASKK